MPSSRVYDSRLPANGGQKLGAGATIELPIVGQVVPPNARSVVLNVTATEPDEAGYLTVYPGGAARRHGDRWEVRVSAGGWMPIENPLERAARDAERVRRWVAHEDRDHVVKVYAAVVSADPSVERTPTCAAVTVDQVPAWLAALPAQRSLTADRQARIAELVTSATIA